MNFYLNESTNELIITMKTELSGLKKLVPNEVDASKEKHVPVVECNKDLVRVTVGSILHPMSEEHLITNIVLHTTTGYRVINLNPTSTPVAEFKLVDGEAVIAAYEYCNLHGLWVTRMN